MKDKTNIIIIEDENMMREAFSSFLSSRCDVNVVGSWPGVVDFLQEKPTIDFDVAIVDKMLKEGNAIDYIEPLKTAYPQCRVLIITAHPEEKDVVKVVQKGGSGILSKDTYVDELMDALEKVEQGKFATCSRVIQKAFPKKDKQSLADSSEIALLNEEQKTILRKVIEGKLNQEIADELSYSLSNIKYRLYVIYKLLKVKNRAQAIIKGLEMGF